MKGKSRREPVPSQRMRKIALVICEGETEASYVNLLKNWYKSTFTETQQAFLKSNTDAAIERAKNLKEFQNPSTGVYKLIEMLKETLRKTAND